MATALTNSALGTPFCPSEHWFSKIFHVNVVGSCHRCPGLGVVYTWKSNVRRCVQLPGTVVNLSLARTG